jgi:hypothetical protein
MIRLTTAVSRLVNGPHHVVLAPMENIFSNFLFLFVAFFWRFLLPCLIPLLLTKKICVLIVLPLLAPLVILLALVGNWAELGVQLELALMNIESSCHCHNLLAVWGFDTPGTLGFKPIKLVLGRDHEGLMCVVC